MAAARGCSEPCSAPATSRSISSPDFPGAVITSVSSGLPFVIVPVLSSSTARTAWMRSRLSPPLIRMPCSAPFPVPTMIAVGVASPNAHGQATTSTATAAMMAMIQGLLAPCMPPDALAAPTLPTIVQVMKVRAAITSTTGTKMPAIVSARRWIGAFDPCACSIMRIIPASTVSAPTFVARICTSPRWLIVAPISSSSFDFSTGMLSPVIIDSSTDELPESTTPSTGTFSPGRTISSSPTRTCSIGISTSFPPRTTWAVRACKPINFLMASLVCPFARASRYLPRKISVTINAAVS